MKTMIKIQRLNGRHDKGKFRKHQTIKTINDYEKAIITICDDVAADGGDG